MKVPRAVPLCIASLGFLLCSAQAQDYYFDPGLTGATTGPSGGTGTWDTGITADYYYSGSDVTFPGGAAGVADFDGSGGTVTVDGSVDPIGINFDGSSPYVVTADETGID